MNISVLMSVYFKENPDFLDQAISSILNQTYMPSEFVIVCDGPLTDELDEVLKKHQESSNGSIIKTVRLEQNMGLGIALQKGLLECSNEIVARMDSDDIAREDRFEKQIKLFEENPNLTLVGSNIVEFNNSIDNQLGKRIVPENNSDIYSYLKKRCPFNHMTVMFKKKDVLEVGNYIDFFYNEDYYLWVRLAEKKFEFFNIQEDLVYARVNLDTYSRRGGKAYYKSEKRLFKYMRQKKIISYPVYLYNVAVRFIVEILLTDKLRSIIFKKFARKRV